MGSRNGCTKPRSISPKCYTGLPPSGAKRTCSLWELPPAGPRFSGVRRTGAKRTCSSWELPPSGARCTGQSVPEYRGNYRPPGHNIHPHPTIYPPAGQSLPGIGANYPLLGQNGPALPAQNALPNSLEHAPPPNYYARNAANVPDAAAMYQMRTPDPSTGMSTPSVVRSSAPAAGVLPGGGNYAAPDPMPTC